MKYEGTALNLETAAQFLVHAERLSEIGCFDWDIQTNAVQWSDGLYRIYGLSPQGFDATLEAFLERVVPEDREQVQNAVQEALKSCGRFSSVERIMHTSGELRYLESCGEVITDEAGRPARLIGVCRDITDQKNLEGQLRLSQKMEAVGQLAAGVAHDFNNLLTVIETYSGLIEMNPEDRRLVMDSSEGIRDASRRASDLTKQLLMFGRPSSQRAQEVQLNDLVENAKPLLESLLGAAIPLVTTLAPGLPDITFDKTHFDQILINLAVNARDAMLDGGTLTVATSLTELCEGGQRISESASGTYVELRVTDTGDGITPEARERVFEPFFSTKPTNRGTGLGLAVVYSVVKEAGGVINLSSEPGTGTTFRILFPASRQKPTDAAPRRNLQRVLLVEDEPSVRRATRVALLREGYDVTEAGSGEEALQLINSDDRGFDLLLTDIVMPGVSGLKLAAEFERKCPAIPVLLMSGYHDDIAQSTSTSYAYLPKPFSVQTLIAAVRDVVSAQGS